MEIICTHDMVDFDALASSVAAQKLFPDAVIVRGRKLSPAVRDFLALHKDRFATLSNHEVDFHAVTRWIVVDVRREERLQAFPVLLERLHQKDASLSVHIFDHHPESVWDLPAQHVTTAKVGSTTTLLVEQLLEKKIALDALEATLLALGIHADTGSLTHAETTLRDLRALGHLMEHGVQLSMLRRYLRAPLKEEPRRVLGRWLDVKESHTVGDVEISIAAVSLAERVEGLAEATSHFLSLEQSAAVFTLVGKEGADQVQVVGRSRSKHVDAGRILFALGGGGHPGAASAIVKGWTLEEVKAKLLRALHEHPPKPERVAELMRSAVMTVPPEFPLQDLEKSLHEWGYTGVPVMKNGKLVGIISKTDLRNAKLGGRMHLSVNSCMAHNLHTTTPMASLDRALDTMVRANVGRLPVLEGDKLVGIITRSAILRVLYQPDVDAS